ncbi:MAG TPA: C4-type zinc ribbon domain-containing protein [Pseudonocardiaceae bacterium]|nr:C4-type zinc ribbon domain-containing protein [Pseudonocardiaceae bacterium]
MKAEPAVQRRLLDLADADAELGRIDHRRRTLPELAVIEEAEASLRVKRDAVVTAKTAHKDLSREITKQEDEIEAVRAREDRDRKLLNDGNVGARQVSDLEHELETLGRRQAALEDDLLELMERREAVELEIKHATVGLDQAEETLADAQQRRDQALADLDTAQARRAKDRELLVVTFPADLLALYDRVRAQKGIGAALLRARRCGACRIEQDRHAIAAIKDAPADEVVRCEECGAIMVRTVESGL